ncbi:hypothetical protein Bbelb_361930 [Branchiostoma belcheri]|nr:hypothetical protein Bbelb_361930 [Branchiostoma belcheri]
MSGNGIMVTLGGMSISLFDSTCTGMVCAGTICVGTICVGTVCAGTICAGTTYGYTRWYVHFFDSTCTGTECAGTKCAGTVCAGTICAGTTYGHTRWNEGTPGYNSNQTLYSPFPLTPLLDNRHVEFNPGPRAPKYPCGVCHQAVRWEKVDGRKAICCDSCDVWYHTDCMGMSAPVYNAINNPSVSWICCSCGLPNFSSSLFNTTVFETSNCFSSFDTSTSSTSPARSIGSPVATSSPIGHSVTPPPRDRTHTKPVRTCVVNFQSIRNKVPELHAFCEAVQPDIVVGTETWLDPSVNSSEVFPDNYNVFRRDRAGRGGGVLVAVRNNIIATHHPDPDCNCELTWVRVHLANSKSIYIGAYYRPPSAGHDDFVALERSVLQMREKNNNAHIWLAGDFNLPDATWNPEVDSITSKPSSLTGNYISLANDCGLEQMVCEPTYTRGQASNTLDLFLTTNPTLVERVKIVPGLSDHDIPLIDVHAKPQTSNSSGRLIYLWRKADTAALQQDMSSFSRDFTDQAQNNTASENWKLFKAAITNAANKHVPRKTVRRQSHKPWITSQIRKAMRKRSELFAKARKTNSSEAWAKFKRCRKGVKQRVRKAHRDYVSNYLETNIEENPKAFWSYVKSIRQDSTGASALRHQGVLTSDPKEKADALGAQFESVFTREDKSIVPTLGEPTAPTIPPINISVEGVAKQLSCLNPNKSTGPDGKPPRLLKTVAVQIAPILQVIFSQSISTGDVPEDWRTANITPIFKKGDRTAPSNYRPVSLTSVCGKVLEHIVHSHMMKHLDTYGILSPAQHGFRKGLSCESQLLLTVQDLAKSIDQNQQVDAAVLDFSKAFDTVPHERLLCKLEYYGISGSLLSWLRAFLTERTQCVVFDGGTSKTVKVTSGVPQGTVLGPLLFLLYINDLPQSVSSHVRLFADDCLIYRIITKPSDAQGLQSDLDALTGWQNRWLMSFNPFKCHILHITRKRHPILTQYTLCNEILTSVKSHPYLGVHLSDDLRWDTHIKHTTSKAGRVLGVIRRNLTHCPSRVKATCYKALVRPHLEYSATVWDPHTIKGIQAVEAVQRRAARVTLNDYRRTSSWNSLPGPVVMAPNVESFRAGLAACPP